MSLLSETKTDDIFPSTKFSIKVFQFSSQIFNQSVQVLITNVADILGGVDLKNFEKPTCIALILTNWLDWFKLNSVLERRFSNFLLLHRRQEDVFSIPKTPSHLVNTTFKDSFEKSFGLRKKASSSRLKGSPILRQKYD